MGWDHWQCNPYFGLEVYSGFEILKKRPLGSRCRRFTNHPKNLCLPLSHTLISYCDCYISFLFYHYLWLIIYCSVDHSVRLLDSSGILTILPGKILHCARPLLVHFIILPARLAFWKNSDLELNYFKTLFTPSSVHQLVSNLGTHLYRLYTWKIDPMTSNNDYVLPEKRSNNRLLLFNITTMPIGKHA